ncbi:hypothetical protein [Capybara microvirus Cap1_SP_107]|nr:hypothetical protein [Capybara microvirus Cap1_SP_107]
MKVTSKLYKVGPWFSQPQDDIRVVVAYDEDGNQYTTFQPYEGDPDKFGTADDWSLSNLMAAGIDPASFNTTYSPLTRLDSAAEFAQISSVAEALIDELDAAAAEPQVSMEDKIE